MCSSRWVPYRQRRQTLRLPRREVLLHLGLLGAGFKEGVAALDAYLDMVEETLEEWGRASGAEYEQEVP